MRELCSVTMYLILCIFCQPLGLHCDGIIAGTIKLNRNEVLKRHEHFSYFSGLRGMLMTTNLINHACEMVMQPQKRSRDRGRDFSREKTFCRILLSFASHQ